MPNSWFLAALTVEERDLLGPLEPVTFASREVVIAAAVPPQHFWFVEHGFISVLRPMRDGRAAEVSYVADRGVMAMPSLWDEGPIGLDFVSQLPGSGWRANIGTLRRAAQRSPGLRRRFRDTARVTVLMLAQSSACNTLHSDEQIIVRRLLAMSTENGPTIPLTQAFLAEQLGFTRQTVSRISRKLVAAKLIRHSRGCLEILDPASLRQRSCECFEVIETARRSLGK